MFNFISIYFYHIIKYKIKKFIKSDKVHDLGRGEGGGFNLSLSQYYFKKLSC